MTILDILSEEGLIERRPAPGSRRTNGIWLTGPGERMLAELLAESRRHDAMLTAGIAAADVATALAVLDRVIANLRADEGA